MKHHCYRDTPEPRLRQRFDLLWLVLLPAFLLAGGAFLISGRYCDYLATDFRGYYATVQIAKQVSLSAIYKPEIQAYYQSGLSLDCPDGTKHPPLVQVMVPYLPTFISLLSPLRVLPFSGSYIIWSVISLGGLILYLHRFSHALLGRTDWLKLLQWVICLPVLANLALGQINLFVVILLGEAFLSFTRKSQFTSGVWLGGLLIKPNLLILMLPGLLIKRQFITLAGFTICAAIVVTASLLLVGKLGIQDWFQVLRSFSQPDFLSTGNMMNARGLAYNLERFLPGISTWPVLVLLTAGIVALVMLFWMRIQLDKNLEGLALITLTGTFIVSWHSNLYLWITLIPFLLILDTKGQIPPGVIALWVFGVPSIALLVSWVSPELVNPAAGLAMLAGNLLFILFTYRQASNRKDLRQDQSIA